MSKILETLQPKFHEFCARCPLCDVEGDESVFYTGPVVDMRIRYVTCAHYDFCKRMARAVNDGLVDMRINQETVSNVDTTQ